ncbi:MAG: PD-(D/E)XK nuclease family protein, partial [Actinomycetota bacterium]
ISEVISCANELTSEMADLGDLHRSLDTVIAPAGGHPPADDRPVATEATVDLPADPAARGAWLDRRRQALRSAGRPATVSATAIATGAVDGEVVDADRVGPWPDEDDLATDEALFRRGRAGTAVGRAVHAVLQDGDLEAGADLDDLSRAAASAEAVPSEREAIRTRVESARSSATVRQALAADRHWRELPVCAPVGGRTVEGYVDLLFEDESGDLVVVDYKTDRLEGPADVDRKVGRYRLQAATYAVALEQVTGRRVGECRFVFATDGDAIERTVADLDEAKREVLDRLAATQSVEP